jgi:hypothetical protein
MVLFCEKVVGEIKNASSEVEVREILIRSVNNYQAAHDGQYNSMLILNLIASMRAAYAGTAEDHVSDMLLAAISVLREYQK